MRVYCYDDTEWWIARDMEHLKELVEAFGGNDWDEYDPADWVELPADKELGMWTGDSPRDGERLVRTCKEWTEKEPAGFLCSTEW